MSDNTSEEMPKRQLPKVPVFNISRVFEIRDRLMDLCLCSYVGTVPTGDEFERMVEDVREVLDRSKDKVDHYSLHASLRHLAGQELTEARLYDVAWRLAANLKTLKEGIPVPPWVRQQFEEWVPVQVVASRYAIQKKPYERHGRSGRMMRFKILSGSPAPLEITQWWSNSKIDVVAYAIGFRRRPPMIKADGSELMSMRFAVLIEPGLSLREPGFYHVSCPPSFMEYNRELIKLRRRIGFECPEGYDHQCYQCPLGVRSCVAACHPEDYEEDVCSACGQNWWFDTDPGFVNDYCIRCQPLISAGIPVKREVTNDGPNSGAGQAVSL